MNHIFLISRNVFRNIDLLKTINLSEPRLFASYGWWIPYTLLYPTIKTYLFGLRLIKNRIMMINSHSSHESHLSGPEVIQHMVKFKLSFLTRYHVNFHVTS